MTVARRNSHLAVSHHAFSSITSRAIRGGSEEKSETPGKEASAVRHSSSTADTKTEFVKLADPAPGAPFHHAFPVHDLEAAKHFYGTILGCAEGRSSTKWQDYSLYGHQIVAHWVGSDYRCQDYFNPVDGDEVPVPHTGLALTEEEFHALAVRVRDAGITFIIEPHLRFKGMPGEQWTMFFKDPSGNNLEFKAMTTLENLFAKYNVADN
jgi:extradiol dioxygenase family protein